MQDWGVGELVYRASLVLLYPTLLMLGLGFLQTMWHLGESAYDAWTSRRSRKQDAARQLRDIHLDEQGSIVPSLTAVAHSRWQHPQLRRFAALLLNELGRGSPRTLVWRIQHEVRRVEAALARDVNRMRVLVRVGPLLGLVGTLIPLGPGLTALAEGDLSRLSTQVVVAFSTTVVGLLVGGISYPIAVARAHTADLVAGDVELVADVVCTLLERQPGEPPAEPTRRVEDKEVSA